MKFLSTVVLVLGVIGSSLAIAEDVAVKPEINGDSYGELTALRSQNAILTEQLKAMELREKIRLSKSGPATVSGPAATMTTTLDRGARIVMVAGSTGQLIATIQLSDGATTSAKVGAKVPGLGLIKSIATNEVIVANGKDLLSVPFASEPVNNATQYGSGTPSYPVVPPMSVMGKN